MKYICPQCSGVITLDEASGAESAVCDSCGRSVLKPSAHLSSGSIIGDFVIKEKLGSGAMGTVYRAHQISLERPVALKILHSTLSEDRRCIERIMKEARTAASFNHPNLIQAYAVGEENDTYYLAMEYVKGISLQDLLTAEKRIRHGRATEIVCQVAAGLEAAWNRAHIVHGDIKPENVMLGDDGTVKIADMGLAQLGKQDPENFEYNTEVTGTPCYMSPEMILGQPVDHRSDLYSLGVTFFESITGVVPFEGADSLEVASKHICAPVPSPKSFVADIPDRVCEVILKLMAKDPQDRYQSAPDLIAALLPGEMSTVTLDPVSPVAYTGIETWQCVSCGHRNPMDGKYCLECGAYGFEACPSCGEEVYVDARFCSACGTNLEQQKEVIQQTWDGLIHQVRQSLENEEFVRASRTAARMLSMDSAHLSRVSVSDFRDALRTLRERLEEVVEDARSGLKLDVLERSLGCLSQLFGDAACGTLAAELEEWKSTLANALYEGNAAYKTNCFSKCREMLEAVPAWSGGTLGDRRGELLTQAREAEEQRRQLLSQADGILANEGNHADAVRYSYELSLCLISQKVLVVEPAEEDVSANTRIRELSSALQVRAVEGIKAWVSENRWPAVLDLMRAVKKCESPYMAIQERALWQSINDEIRTRYNEARLRERRGSVGRAQRAWNDILLIPGELLPGKVRREAKGFTDRRRSLLMAARRPSLGLQFAAIFFSWCVAFCFEAADLLKAWMEGNLEIQALQEAGIPLAVQLVVLLVFYRILLSRKVMSGADLVPGLHPSWYMTLLCLAWVLSPVSGVIYRCYSIIVGELFSGPVWSDLWHVAGIVALFWALADFVRIRHCRGFPNALALTLSWGGAACVNQLLWGHTSWTPLRHMAGAGIQGVLFVFIEVVNYAVNRKKPFFRPVRQPAFSS